MEQKKKHTAMAVDMVGWVMSPNITGVVEHAAMSASLD